MFKVSQVGEEAGRCWRYCFSRDRRHCCIGIYHGQVYCNIIGFEILSETHTYAHMEKEKETERKNKEKKKEKVSRAGR